MYELKSDLIMNDKDADSLRDDGRRRASSHSLTWYLTLYLAGLLLTNGLADAVHNILHDVL